MNMQNYCHKNCLCAVILWLPLQTVNAQKVDSKVSKASLSVNGQELEGYSIRMDFTKKEIFKAWWKYSKEFSRNETKKDDVKHTIPPKEGESTVPIVFYSRVGAPDSLTAKITAALSDNGMPSDDVSKYNKQISQLLSDFRVDYYRNNLQQKITNTEKRAGKIGKFLDRYTTAGIKLDQKIKATMEEKTAHQEAIIENDSLIIELTQKLNVNRIIKDSVNLELEKIKETLEELRELIKGIR